MVEAKNSVQNIEKPVKKKRSESEKVGRLKYILQRIIQLAEKMDSIDRKVDRIDEHLKHDVDFGRPDILEVCKDEVDQEIVQLLFEAGSPGLLPKDIAAKLERFRIQRFQVSRRIIKMNKSLDEKLREKVAEQRGWHWALTSFAVEAWGEADMNPTN